MDYDKLKTSVRSIKMPDEMKNDILSYTRTSGQDIKIKSRPQRKRFIRTITAAAAAVLCIMVTVPVLAAKYEPVYEAMYSVAPAAAQFFKPVNMSDEDNGIRMEVVSASVHDSTAQIYITIQDMTSDRIDSTVDLYDSYDINTPFDSTGNCTLESFDETTGKATFLITIDMMHKEKITGKKLTFSVAEFLSNKNIYKATEIPYDNKEIKNADCTQEVMWSGGSGPKFDNHQETYTALAESAPSDDFPIKGIEMTGMGYIDGKLHIQVLVRNLMNNDNHGFFYFMDQDSDRVDLEYDFSFIKYNGDKRLDYIEYVFDIPHEKLSEYTLKGDFWTCDTLTRGDWSVTFPIN